MTGTIIFFVLGTALLVVLFFSFRRGVPSPAKIKDLSAAHEVLSTLQSELLPDWFVDRLFSKEDWQFAQNQDCHEIAPLFDRERKAVALSWLGQTREHVAQLMDFHLRLARERPDLKPSIEVKLSLEYAQFQMLCGLLASLIRTLGPVRVRSLVGFAVNAAANLGKVSEKVLSDLNGGVTVGAEGR